MCVIVHKQKDVPLSQKVLRECWNQNPHGAGIMWTEDQKLSCEKGFMTFASLWSRLSDESLDFKGKECVIHFRYGTAGLKTPELCHPFIINPNLAFVHNGILSHSELYDPLDQKSDTQLLCLKIFKQLPQNFLNNRGISLLLENYFQGSVFVFMDSSGKVTKMGEIDNGIETDGYWFSNYYWSMNLFKKTFTQLKGETYNEYYEKEKKPANIRCLRETASPIFE